MMQVAVLSPGVSEQRHVIYDQVKCENLQQPRIGRAGEDLLCFGVSISVNDFNVNGKHFDDLGNRDTSRWIELHECILFILPTDP